MLFRPLSALALVGAFCAATPSAWAQASGAAASDPQAREVRAWLLRIHEAAGHRNFQGTFVVSGGGAVSSARIAHFCEGPNQFERSEALDGVARHVYRHNEVVTTFWPATKTAMVEQRDMLAQFPALLQAGDDRIAEFYQVQPQPGAERVAGREANVLIVKPRDQYRYGYRLWADQASGLLLRADVIGEHSEVLESSAFSDVTIGVKPQPESVLQPMKKLDGYRVLRPVLTSTKLEAEGWAMRQSVPGFREVSCVKRPMDGADNGKPAADQQVLQTIFSDGLTYVSVFIEPFNPQRHTRAITASVGPTQTLMQQQGDWWVTLVGDVPPATLRLFAKGLERSKK
ncbi:MAG: MucB/RseB C-terminal domain-containing protein [Burkholderiales bacterium]